MKIMQIATQMEAGGAQRVAYLLNEGLRARGHDGHLLFLYKKRSAYRENGYTRCLRETRPRAAEWPAMAKMLWQVLHKERPDAVITHTHSANGFAAPIAALAGVPIRVPVHHNPVETYSILARGADRIAFALGLYSSMVAVSGGVSRSFGGYGANYRSRLHRIYNGIGVQQEHVGQTDIRVRYGIPAVHFVLVNVGRLSKQKNQRLLLEMLRDLDDATLLIVGDGELAGEMRRSAASFGVATRVRFTGELPMEEVADILQQADLFLLPSLYESFCLAAVEAMQHGLPVVATDMACLREVLGDRQLFFPLNDTKRLLAIVARLLVSPEERKTMAEAGRARARLFSVERMVTEYECLIQEAGLYGRPRTSAADNFRRVDALGGIPGIHDQL